MNTSTDEKGLRGIGGSQWETMDGMSFVDLWNKMGGAFAVTPQKAMRNAVVMLCVDILHQDISKAPLYLRKMTPRGSSVVIRGKDHDVAGYFALDPNARHTWREVWGMVVSWLALKSNSYIYAPRNRRGDIKHFVPLQESHVQDLVNPTSREVFYEIAASTEHERALLGFSSKRVPERDIIHFRSRMMDGFSGLPTIEIGSDTIELSESMEVFRKDLVSEAGQMRGVFKKKEPGALTEQSFQRLMSQLTEMMRQHISRKRPIVLEDGIEFQETSANPQEMELAKQFENQVVMTCRLFRMPPHKALHLVNVKYENMEVLEKSYVGDTLEPILTTLEQRLTRNLLSTEDRLNGYFLEFDRSALTLRDPKVQMETTHKFYTAGLITRGEARVEHGWEENTSRDDVFLVPNSSILVDKNNKPLIELPKPPASPKQEAEPVKALRLVGGQDA